MNEESFQVGIKALIMDESNQVLVMFSTSIGRNRHPPHWDIPGGRIEKNHSIEETLRKEIKEELGIDNIDVIEQLDAGLSKISINVDGVDTRLLFIIYKCKLPTDYKIILSDEHRKYKWVSISEATELLRFKFADSLIEKMSQLETS